MPIIEHSSVRMSEVINYRRQRTLLSAEQGATSLTIKEVELHPGWEGRLHTHPTDIVWQPPGPGRYTLMSKATNNQGETQPMEFPNQWDGRGYGNNMVFPVEVEVH